MKPTATTTNWIRRLTAIAAAMAMGWSPTALAGEPEGCEPGWAEGAFPVNPVDIGLNGEVLAMAEFDSGNGPQLIVGGSFTRPANDATQILSLIARWNGEGWESIGRVEGSASRTKITSMAVFDDGNGPKLYVGGRFQTIDGIEINGIASWDGTTWSPVGELEPSLLTSGFSNEVRAMAVYRRPTGEEVLVVGGDFASIDGLSNTQHVACWNGDSWSSLAGQFGSGELNGPVYSLRVQELGEEQILYAGGRFFVYTSEVSNNVALWNGYIWIGMGPGLGAWRESTVHTLEIFDAGSGPAVYAGGDLKTEDGSPLSGVRRWDGTQWADLGTGVSGNEPVVYSLRSASIEGVPKLLVGGSFTSASTLEASGLALWDGAGWSTLQTDVEFDSNDVVRTIYAPSDDSIAELVVGGGFGSPALRSSNVARWNDGVWLRPANIGLNGSVRQFLSPRDPSQTGLTVFGDFSVAGEAVETDGAGIFDNGDWSDTGYGYIDPAVKAVWFDDGSGESLHAVIPDGSGLAADVHKWTGSEWQPLGIPEFLGGEFPIAYISDIEVYTESGNEVLYVVGWFEGNGSPYFAAGTLKWDGLSWTAPFAQSGAFIDAFDVVQRGTYTGEPALFFSSDFPGLVIWDGSEQIIVPWEVNGEVVAAIGTSIRVVGQSLFARFGTATSSPLHTWDGQEWSELPLTPNSGGPPNFTWYPSSLFEVQEPGGDFLYIVEGRWIPGSRTKYRLLRYSGTDWSVILSEIASPIRAVTAHDDGTGPALYIGGDFTQVDGVPSGFMAKRPFCDNQPCPADVTGDGLIDLADLNTVLASFGHPSDIGDTNGDGVVDLADLNTVLGAFGAVCK